MRANYHTHSTFDDGKASPEVMAMAAFEGGYRILGFSAHAPLPFETRWALPQESMEAYTAEILRLASLWEGRGLEILLGLEIDWIEGLCGPGDGRWDGRGLDFRLGSVHYIRPGSGEAFTVDGPAAEFDVKVREATGGDGRRIYQAYYRNLGLMIEAGNFDILAHLDLIARNNAGSRWFDEGSEAYLSAAMEVIELLPGRSIVVEVNIGAMARGRMAVPHPSLLLMKRLRELRIPITFSVDAHQSAHLGVDIGGKFNSVARDLAREAGYRNVAILTKGRWIDVGIDET
jgi:histidinol-phosphatase (PHP family)